MKTIGILAVITPLFILILWISTRTRLGHHSHQSQPFTANQKADPSVYLGLRNLALQGQRPNVQTLKPTEPYAVLMDWGVSEGTATVAAFADGTASVYLSSGGGFLGGGQSHESIRNAAKQTVQIAGELQALMQQTTSYPLPRRGQVTFYVRCDAGVFTATASEEDIRNHNNPFYRLGDAAQEIITQYRLVQTSR